jgi:hypothetical protein
MKQKILGIPQTYSSRLVEITDQKEMAAKLKKMALSVLEELRNLPQRVADPNWLQEFDPDLRAQVEGDDGENTGGGFVEDPSGLRRRAEENRDNAQAPRGRAHQELGSLCLVALDA